LYRLGRIYITTLVFSEIDTDFIFLSTLQDIPAIDGLAAIPQQPLLDFKVVKISQSLRIFPAQVDYPLGFITTFSTIGKAGELDSGFPPVSPSPPPRISHIITQLGRVYLSA
jgi:hypothetical protein